MRRCDHRLLAGVERRIVDPPARTRAMAAEPGDHAHGQRRRGGSAGAFKHGLYHYLLKPDGFEELAAVTGAAMESKRREDFNELMAMIVNSIPDGVHSVDAAGRITAINQAALQMYGYTEHGIVGRANEILLPAGRRD